MNFGEFDESNLFHIENSKIYRDLGDGIKTVEFILKYKEDSIIFLEAKKKKVVLMRRNGMKQRRKNINLKFIFLH